MKILFWSFVCAGCISGLIAVRYKHRIKSRVVQTILLVNGTMALFGIAGYNLHTLTIGFSTWNALASINALVPLGWFMAGSFAMLQTIVNARNARLEQTKTKPNKSS